MRRSEDVIFMMLYGSCYFGCFLVTADSFFKCQLCLDICLDGSLPDGSLIDDCLNLDDLFRCIFGL